MVLPGVNTFNVSIPTVNPLDPVLINTGAEGIELTVIYNLLLVPTPHVLMLEFNVTQTESLLFNEASV